MRCDRTRINNNSIMATADEIRAAIAKWRQADKDAATAEKRVADESFRHFQKLASAVPPDVIGDAKLLRSLANKNLKQALEMMQQGPVDPGKR